MIGESWRSQLCPWMLQIQDEARPCSSFWRRRRSTVSRAWLARFAGALLRDAGHGSRMEQRLGPDLRQPDRVESRLRRLVVLVWRRHRGSMTKDHLVGRLYRGGTGRSLARLVLQHECRRQRAGHAACR